MKPITSLLLIVAIVCYVFMPLFEISMTDKDLTGLTFTIDAVTNGTHVFVAILPFLSSFLAIGFNSLKNRYWGIAVVLAIIMGLYFFPTVYNFSGIPLAHDPEVAQDAEFQEGMRVTGIGLGFRVSFISLVLALVSAIISLMPLKINRFIEQSIDSRIEVGKKHLASLTHDKKRHHRKDDDAMEKEKEEKSDDNKVDTPQESPYAPPQESPYAPPTPPQQSTDHSAYMPH